MKKTESILLGLEGAKKLSTHRLLAYYRKHAYTWSLKYECDSCYHACPCKNNDEYKEKKTYFERLKALLDAREHSEKDHKQ